MIETAAIGSFVFVVVVEAVTVSVALPDTVPVNPAMLAEIVVVPADSAVASPAAFTVATLGALEVQVAKLVTFAEVAGWLPWPYVPVAVNSADWPCVKD
jgi:hypothetical protein